MLRGTGNGARGGWERWRYHENEEGFCSDFKEREEMLKHVRMFMEQCRRAGWHSEDPRHKQGSQDTKSGGGARRVGRSHYMHGLLLPLQPQQGNIVVVHVKRIPHRRYFVARNDMKI